MTRTSGTNLPIGLQDLVRPIADTYITNVALHRRISSYQRSARNSTQRSAGCLLRIVQHGGSCNTNSETYMQTCETLSAGLAMGAYLHALLEVLDRAETSTSFDEKALSFNAEEDFSQIVVLLGGDSAENEELDFADRFREYVLKYRTVGVRTFERFCLTEGANLTVLAEGLREFGRMNEPSTEDARMQLLRKCLTHPSPRIRDAAGLGLSLLGDKRAIPFLERAVRAEKRPLCRMTLEKALAQLRV